MAGIIGYVGSKQAGPIILEALRRLEYRGYDSTGLAVGSAKAFHVRRAVGKLRNLQAAVRLDPVRGTYGIGHASWTAAQASPTSPDGPAPAASLSLAVVLCGKPTNMADLRSRYSVALTADSEISDADVLTRLVISRREDGAPLEEAVQRATAEVGGSCAFAAIAEDEPGKVVVARRGLSVLIGLGKREHFIATDVRAILNRSRDMIQLKDGDIAVVTARGVRVMDSEGLPVSRMVDHVRWDPLMAERSGYKHFMVKEIFEQPRAIRETALGRLDEETGEVILDELGVTSRELRDIGHLNIIGCGSSWHSALTAKAMIERLARVHVEVEYGSEFRYSEPLIDRKVLTLVLSQSGETPDSVACLKLAHERGSKTVAVCNSEESTIAKTARGGIYTQAGPELAALSTKSFTSQLAALYLFAMHLGQVRGKLPPELSKQCARDLLELPSLVESALELTVSCERLARHVAHGSKFLYLGRGLHFPIALEGARKLQELAHISAEGCAGGEMRHGPKALIDADMFVVVIATVDDKHRLSRLRYEKTVAQIGEVAARQGRVICVTNQNDDRLRENAHEIIRIPSTSELLQPIVTIVPLQLLAYHVAALRGYDIDQPRDLGKSVTGG